MVLDEPVSALDVSIQSQILNLLADLKSRLGLAYILISHDLSVIAHMCDRVAVMYLGRIVETGPSEDVFADPCHPYTQALLSAMPGRDANGNRQRIVLAGEPPNPEAGAAGLPLSSALPEGVFALCRHRSCGANRRPAAGALSPLLTYRSWRSLARRRSLSSCPPLGERQPLTLTAASPFFARRSFRATDERTSDCLTNASILTSRQAVEMPSLAYL